MWTPIPVLLMCAGADRTWESSHNLARPVPPASANPVFTSFQPHWLCSQGLLLPECTSCHVGLPTSPHLSLPITTWGGLPRAPSLDKSCANLSQHHVSTVTVPKQRVVMYRIWAYAGSMPCSSALSQANLGQGPHLGSPSVHNRSLAQGLEHRRLSMRVEWITGRMF